MTTSKSENQHESTLRATLEVVGGSLVDREGS